MVKNLIDKNDNMFSQPATYGKKASLLMLNQTPIFLLLLLTGCFASAPVTDDNATDYTDYGIIQPSSANDDDDDIIFGGERHFNLNTVDTVATSAPYTISPTMPNKSLSNISQTITLPALAIQKTDITEYQRAIGAQDLSDYNIIRTITIADITSPAASLTLDGSGVISSVTAYFADNTYTGTGASNSDITSGAPDTASDARIRVDRRMSVFGFETEYMAHITWVLQRGPLILSADNPVDNVFTINGTMIAGIETENSNIPSSDIITFMGKGEGEYSEKEDDIAENTKRYNTEFDITAKINFAERNIVAINSTETMRCTENSGCTIGAGNLDFRATNLSFSKNNLATNTISGNLLINDTSFSGRINARFYGPNADEFGGTFALVARNESYYYGTFGSKNMGVFDDKIYDDENGGFEEIATTVSPREAINYDDYASLNDASAGAISDGAIKRLTLPALAVQRNSGASPLQRITKEADTERPFLTISFDASGNLSEANASFVGTTYMLTGGTPASSTLLSGATDFIPIPTTNVMKAIRADNSLFDSFAPKYMAYVTWELRGGTDSDGYMMAGIETVGTGADAIPIQYTGTFWGKGIGTYHSNVGSIHVAVKFDARAKVNFANQTVALSSTNTSCVALCGLSADDLNNLEFDTTNNQTAKYRQGVNVIGGGIENADATMSGRFDARFYGKRAVEIGGTFIMKNADDSRYYLGAFGAQRP